MNFRHRWLIPANIGILPDYVDGGNHLKWQAQKKAFQQFVQIENRLSSKAIQEYELNCRIETYSIVYAQ